MIKISYDNATKDELLDHFSRMYQRLILVFSKIDLTPIKEIYTKMYNQSRYKSICDKCGKKSLKVYRSSEYCSDKKCNGYFRDIKTIELNS